MSDDFEYTAESILVLEGLEPVRMRPGMYLGDLENGFAMHQMVWNLVEHALGEHLEQSATRIAVDIEGDQVTIEVDGHGIPIEPINGVPALEMYFTTLSAHGWPRGRQPPGLHGIGPGVTNALARELEVRTCRDGHAYVQRYERGKRIRAVENIGPTICAGTRVSFVPDFDILPRLPWNMNAITARCRDLAALHAGLTIIVNGETHRYVDGIADRVREISGWLDPFHVRTKHDDVSVDVALAWAPHCRKSLRTFVNANATSRGSHVEALFDVLVSTIGSRLPSTRGLRKQVERGLVGILHVELPDPRYKSQLKAEILNPEAGVAVRTIEQAFARYLDETPAMLDTMLLQLSGKARRARA